MALVAATASGGHWGTEAYSWRSPVRSGAAPRGASREHPRGRTPRQLKFPSPYKACRHMQPIAAYRGTCRCLRLEPRGPHGSGQPGCRAAQAPTAEDAPFGTNRSNHGGEGTNPPSALPTEASRAHPRHPG